MKKIYTFSKEIKVSKFLILFLMLCSIGNVWGQITTNVTMSGSAIAGSPFSSFQSAITAVNALTITGPVVVNVAAGGTETLTAKIVMTATGTSSNTITIQKSGSGANPKLTSYGGTTTTPSILADGFFVIAGGDYITIDGIDLQEAAANTTTTTVMEFGYALAKASVTDGAQNNTIKNCTITLNRVQNASGTAPWHAGSCGIVVLNTLYTTAAAITPTAASGTNSFNKFYSNTIQNANCGIVFIAYSATAGVGPNPNPATFLGDLSNDVGGTSAATGNTILNYGGATAAGQPATGIFANNQWSMNCSYNTINNNNGSGVNHSNTLRGIFLNSSSTSANVTCNNNNITVKSAGTTTQLSGIECSYGSTAAGNTVEISNNTISGEYLTATTGAAYLLYTTSCTPANLNIMNNDIGNFTYSASALAGSGAVYGIYQVSSSASTVLNIKNNNIHDFSRTGNTGGSTMGIYQSGGVTGMMINIKNNIVNNLSIDGTGATSLIYGIQTVTGTIVVDSNTIDSLYCRKTSGTSAIYGFYNLASPVNENYNYNNITNLIHNGTGTVSGMYFNTVTGARNCSYNTIYNIKGAGTSVYGLYHASSSPNIFNNKIYNIESTSNAAPTVCGIMLTTLGTSGVANIYNNLISDLKAPSASTNTVTSPAIRGINLTASTSSSTINVSNNSVYLTGSSSGANFGSACIFHTTSTTATTASLVLRNNIFVNGTTPLGTGLAVAYQRSSTALDNYSLSSNRNDFYAGTPGASNLIFYDGTNSDQTIAAFQSRVSTREANSFSENPTFVSTTPSSVDHLKIDVSVPTQLESGGTPISGISGDFGGNTRNTSTPDIGAWEFNGVTPAPAFANLTPSPALSTLCTKADRTINIDVSTSAGSISSVILNYSHNGTAQTPVTMTNTSGSTWSGTIVAPATGNNLVTWTIVATNSLGLSSTYNGSSYSDEPNTGITATATAFLTSACVGSPDTLSIDFTGVSTPTSYPAVSATNATTDEDLVFVMIHQGTDTILKNTSTHETLNGTIGTPSGTAGSYSNFTSFGPYNLKIGQTYTITMTNSNDGTAYTNYFYAWIDYNADGDYVDAGESIFSSASGSGIHTKSTTFTIPSTAAIGTYRMRVANTETSGISGTSTSFTYGEWEEYMVKIEPNVTNHNWVLNNSSNVSNSNPYSFAVLSGSNDYKDSMTINNCPLVSNTVTINNAIAAFTATTISSSLSSTFCSGNTSTLSTDATGGCTPYSYTWTGGSTGATLNVTTSGTYEVTISDAAGTLDTLSISITVNSLPSISISPALASVCGTAPAKMDAIPLVGTSSYTWSINGSAAVIGLYNDATASTAYTAGSSLSTVYAKPTGNTTYSVTVTDVNSCTAVATKLVNVFDAISSYKLVDPTILCAGGNGQLIDSPWVNFNVTNYTFAQSSTTYTPISTGTGATDLGSTILVDDLVIDSVPIGFSFNLADSNYSQIAVSSNGWISPHTTAITGSITANNLATNRNMIAPFWEDNNMTGGSVLYQTTGTAPNRVLTIQWTGMHTGTSGSATNPTIDVQAKLYETTNAIEFIYGSSSGALVGTTASIGISGAVGKYQSLNNSTSSAASSSTTNTTTISSAAASGQKYSFTPIVSSFTHTWTNSLGASGATLSATNIYNPTVSSFVNTENYIDSIYETNSGCYRLDTLTINLSTGPPTLNAINSTAGNSVCVGYGTTLSPDFSGGCGPYTYNWSDDPNPGATTLATTLNFAVTPTATTTYYLTITDNFGLSVTNVLAGGYTLSVNNPTPSTTPQNVCSSSSAFTLGATASTSGNLLRWYSAATGGTYLTSGGTYTTPVITATTNYYIDETEKSGLTNGLGRTTAGVTTATTLANYGLIFTLTKRAVIDTVKVYLANTSPSTVNVGLRNSSGTILTERSFNVPAGNATTPVLYSLPLDFVVEAGTGYRLYTSAAGASIVRNSSGATFPYSLGAFGNITSSTTSASAGTVSSTTYYFFYDWSLSDAGCTGTRVPVTATLSTPPTITPTVSSSSVCNGLSTNLNVTSGNTGYTYTWYPGALSGASQTVSPTHSNASLAPEVTTYTVSATDASLGCTVTSTIDVSVNPNPIINSYTEQLTTHCSGDINKIFITTPQAGLKDYSYSVSSGSSLDPMTGATQIIGNSIDDGATDFTPSPAFNFSFAGNTYSSFSAASDGWLKLGSGGTSDFSNAVTDATNLPKLYPYWDDLATGNTGEVRYVVNGTAPNRIMVVDWYVTIPRNTTGNANSSFQVWLYESDGKIEYRYGTMGSASMSASIGATVNATTYQSVNTSFTASSTTTATNNISAQPSSGSMFTYTKPAAPTYNWTPTTGLYTNSAATTAYAGGASTYDTMYAKNTSTQTYTVTLANSYGCTNDTTIKDSVKTAAGNVVLVSASVSGAATQCLDSSGWTYYESASTPNQFIFGIKKGTSGLAGETVSIGVNATPYTITASSNGTNQEHQSFLMGRDWNVTATTQPNTPVQVRFFFDPADTTAVNTARDAAYTALTGSNSSTLAVKSAFEWFKTVGTVYDAGWRSSIVGNQFPSTHIKLTPTYGSINGVNYVEFTVASFSGGTGGAGFGAPGAGGVGLPVTWAGFDVKATEIGNELVWKTASEKNTDYFQVEYSYDGSAFTTLANKITAAGNSVDVKTYNFTHSDFATYVYYRIKQVDKDGRVDYSQIKYVKRSALSTFNVSVYPVPMKEDNIVNVKVSSVDKSTLSIRLTDITGKVIRTKSFTPQTETVLESYDMSPLSSGIYFIEVKNGQGKEVIKIAR